MNVERRKQNADVKRVRMNTFGPTLYRYAAVWIATHGGFEGEEGIHSENFRTCGRRFDIMTEMVDISIQGLWWGHEVGAKERRWERAAIILDWRLNNPRLTYFGPRYKSRPKQNT